jgi:lipopolysaccharide export system permease protein
VTLLSRYLITQYLRALLACLCVATSILFLFELFEKLGQLEPYAATPTTVGAYLALKIPSFVADAYPATALLATLLSFGALARRGEMLALRACGVSRWQVLAPLVVSALAMSLVALAWCERVVPASSSRSRLIRDNVIKQRDTHGSRAVASIWMQSTAGFLTVDFYDASTATLYGLSIFQTSNAMHLDRIVEASSARWRESRWELDNATVKQIGPGAAVNARSLDPGEIVLTELPSSFEKRRPKAKEMTRAELGTLIGTLEARRLPVDELRVERHMKLAWPFSGLVTLLVGFPLAVRGGRRFGLGYNVAAGLAVGFAYWALLAVCAASGKSGGIPPVVAAWGPNVVFAAIGCALCMRRDV